MNATAPQENSLPDWGLLRTIKDESRFDKACMALRALEERVQQEPDGNLPFDLKKNLRREKYYFIHYTENFHRAFVRSAHDQLKSLPPGQRDRLEESLGAIADRLFQDFLCSASGLIKLVEYEGKPSAELQETLQKTREAMQALEPGKTKAA